MSTTHRFIDDLIPVILENNDHWWPRDLCRLATVSPGWLFHIRKILYSTPNLHSFDSCSLLARTFTENEPLSALLTGINLRPMHGSKSKPLSAKDRNSLRFILSLDGLRSVTIGGYLAVRAERFLGFLGRPDMVHELHIDGSLLHDALSSRPSLEWDESMMYRFPNLQKLQLTRLELDIIPPTIPSTLALTNLVFNNVDIISGYISYILHTVPTLDRLCVITKTSMDFDEQVRLMLGSCAIRVLHYEVQGEFPSGQSIFTGDTPSSSSLQSLYLKGLPLDVESLSSIQQHFQNLEELSIGGRTVHITLDEWVAFVRSGALPLLRFLGVPQGTYCPPFLRWTASVTEPVRKASAIRNIELSLN